MVGVNRLRRAVERVDHIIEQPGGHIHRVQEGAFAQARMWVWRPGAQEQRRAVDAAAGQHVVARLDGDGASGRGHATFVHCYALQAGDLVVLDQQLLGASQVKQFAAFFQRGGDGGDDHRLLGIGRAAQAAVAQVPAATHVARDHVPAVAELFTAFLDHIVVGVGWHQPRGDAEALLHFLEPGRHLGRAVAFDVVFPGPVLEGRLGGAKARGPVDQCRAAHRAPLKDGDRAVLAHAADAFLVEVGVGLVFQHLEVAAGLERAFFNQQHLVAGGAEDLGGGTAARAAADDGNVGFQRQVIGQLRAIVGFPAAGHAFAERVGYGHLGLSFYFK
ncbi:hypothetical protein D3C85_740800 [compost metagenome]